MNEEIKQQEIAKVDLAPMIPKSILDLKKIDRINFVANVKEALKEGLLEPLQVNTFVKQLETIAKEFTEDKEYKQMILDEALKYGKGNHEYGNTKFMTKEAGVTWDFVSCGDPIYDDLVKRLDERKTFLKGLPKEGMDLIVDGGEVKKIFPPVRNSSTIVQTSIL